MNLFTDQVKHGPRDAAREEDDDNGEEDLGLAAVVGLVRVGAVRTCGRAPRDLAGQNVRAAEGGRVVACSNVVLLKALFIHAFNILELRSEIQSNITKNLSNPWFDPQSRPIFSDIYLMKFNRKKSMFNNFRKTTGKAKNIQTKVIDNARRIHKPSWRISRCCCC